MNTTQAAPSVLPAKKRSRPWWLLIYLAALVTALGLYCQIRPISPNPVTANNTATSTNSEVVDATSTTAAVPDVDPSQVPVQIYTAETDNTLAAYIIMADGSWQTIGRWNKAPNETGGIVFQGTPTPGIYTLWRTTEGEVAVVNAKGQTQAATAYPFYLKNYGRLNASYKLGPNSYLVNGSSAESWPTANNTNNDLFFVDETTAIKRKVTLAGIINNRLDGLRLHAVSADQKTAYATVAGYEGNTVDQLWKINLENSTYDQLAQAETIKYFGVKVDLASQRALLNTGTSQPCTNCFGGDMIDVPAKVKLLNLETNALTVVHESTKYMPQIFVPVMGKVGYINEVSTEREANGSIRSYTGQGIWQVDLVSGTTTQINKAGIIDGMDASGRFLLFSDSLPNGSEYLGLKAGSYQIYDTVKKTSQPVAIIPDSSYKAGE